MICTRLTLIFTRLGERTSTYFLPRLFEKNSIHVMKEAVIFLLRTRDGGHFIFVFKLSLLVSNLERYYDTCKWWLQTSKIKCTNSLMKGESSANWETILHCKRLICLLFKYSFSHSKSGNFFFFFTFSKTWVGRAMGNETFYWDGLVLKKNIFFFHSFAALTRQIFFNTRREIAYVGAAM